MSEQVREQVSEEVSERVRERVSGGVSERQMHRNTVVRRTLLQAFSTAMPYMSLEAEAAVGEVLGTLSVEVSSQCT